MTETTADVIHLDDLATPRYSAEAQAIREMMATVAADFPLDADVLHERARADTGL
ncbi:sulfotransferase, partial [Mycobacterium manitobense]|nr:sulfotransferase [[Mycobacterium] manitobense]